VIAVTKATGDSGDTDSAKWRPWLESRSFSVPLSIGVVAVRGQTPKNMVFHDNVRLVTERVLPWGHSNLLVAYQSNTILLQKDGTRLERKLMGKTKTVTQRLPTTTMNTINKP
jgi:hypothetical protein